MIARSYRLLGRPFLAVLLGIGFTGTIIAASGDAAAPQEAPPPAAAVITISNVVPGELNPAGGGAANASLEQAAAFAWQEFIALNWPAKLQNGQPGDRDTPASDCAFGDPACAARPLTWQTFRGKAEIFNLLPTRQPYDALPTYQGVYATSIASCVGPQPKGQAPWVNLDETDQITLDAMYSGVGLTSAPGNSSPQLVRFLAKANRAEYNYATLINAVQAYPTALRTATINYLQKVGNPPPGGTSMVSLPNNTIEIKAGWRQLNPQKEDVTRFHTATVRYYEPNNAGGQCYRDAVWGMVALHIIQKTPSAPYFIYASFEQADNIRLPNGQPVEDADGNILAVPPCRADQTAPCPTTPSVMLNDTATVSPYPQVPPNIVLQPSNAAYCTPRTGVRPVNQLYYLNTKDLPGLPTGGFICVNQRANAIPPTIVAANRAAHAAIAGYNQSHGIQRSPWSFYKLVNVQYAPIDKTVPGRYTGNDPTTGRNPASYYLSNIVVETNGTLQTFSGGLVGGVGGSGANSDYASQFPRDGTTVGTHKNTYNNAVGHDMGGCMGCHGSQGQSLGADFSVILANGAVSAPETPPAIGSSGARARTVRNRRLAFGH